MIISGIFQKERFKTQEVISSSKNLSLCFWKGVPFLPMIAIVMLLVGIIIIVVVGGGGIVIKEVFRIIGGNP